MPSCLRASPLELHHFKPIDPVVYDMICRADTIGVFQIESRAQMSMLPRLRPQCFYDLVIEVAIVRPGPIQGNMVHPYLRRRSGEEEVTYPSEALRSVLHKTLGVPLFQEQAMKVAMVAAGFSADEADQLRKAMAAWRKTAKLEEFRDKIINGMLARNYTQQFAEQTFDQIRGFGEYGFPESHAASFALLVYVSCWLKRYHPAAFAAALINSQPMGFYAPAQILRDAQEHGVTVLAIDVNFSEWDCVLVGRHEGTEARRVGFSSPNGSVSDTGFQPVRDALEVEKSTVAEAPRTTHGLEARVTDKVSQDTDPSCLRPPVPPTPPHTWGLGGPAIRLGMRMVKGLRADYVMRLVKERKQNGPFRSIRELRLRTAIPKPALQRLAEADAFGSMGLPRREALWQVLGLEAEEAPLFEQWERELVLNERHEGTEALRHEGLKWPSSPSSPRVSVPPSLPAPSCLPPMPLGQEVMTDYTTFGLSLKSHPMALVRPELTARKIITAAEMKQQRHGKWVRVAGLVLVRQRPGTASGIVFETLEDETGIVNLIVRPKVYDQYKQAARYAVMVEAQGIVERQGEVIHVMVKKMEDLTHLVDGLRTKSRDFH
ncbi:helix-hairpin-helix domain-containing protein [Humisphaera borealis]|uniref:helix-hairpin-helix domain-containing protein n=1 Tax=Humisphaera borealis TaxID=2807512 RepID=UPI0021BC4EF4|nr:OB-fold nucleic acid binding domain-containing protein [Humisphaera borealis]